MEDSLHTAIPGCAVSIDEFPSGTTTDTSGHFTFKLLPGKYTVNIYHIGYEHIKQKFLLEFGKAEKSYTFKLHPAIYQQNEVTIVAQRNESPAMQNITSKDLVHIPTIFNDVLRSVTVLSGVVTNNELSSGYNVHGGNFTENLLYLNGYEIYRPFLLQQGSEENQTLMNPDMVEYFKFYTNAFPVTYGDKMSSVLAVDYKKDQADTLTGKVRASLLNAGFLLGEKTGDVSVSISGRYAYPNLFLNQLQSEGHYHPSYADIQGLVNYSFSPGSNLGFFFLYAKNVHNLTPTNWSGNFKSDRGGLISGLMIQYAGEQKYSFLNSLFAMRYSKKISGNLSYTLSLSQFYNSEKESENLTGEFYYIPDADKADQDREYLKTSNEFHDNYLKLHITELQSNFLLDYTRQTIAASMFFKFRKVEDAVKEITSAAGPAALSESTDSLISSKNYTPNEYGFFIMDTYKPFENFEMGGGIRGTYESDTKEFLLSPRFQAKYTIDTKNELFAGWGYYYQPPYYLERRNNDVPLISQKAIHYSLGWQTSFKKTMSLRVELYYRKLDNLIPYYTDGQKIIYSGTNQNEGYAYGMDVMVAGELVEGVNSKIAYSYLSTKERPKTGGEWVRRLADQTHTLSIFLQDRIKRRSNWQVHTKLNAGSGILSYDRNVVTDAKTGAQHLEVAYDRPLEFLLYFRVDMGCSAYFDLKGGHRITCTAEVLNMFNQYNYAGYKFVQVFKDITYPVRIPEVLSGRFYNVQVEYEL